MIQRKLLVTSILSVFAFLTSPTPSLSQSAPPTADTYSLVLHPTTNYGTQPIMLVQQGSNGYLQFDLSGLPAGAIVNKAMLRLFLDSVSGSGKIDAYQLGYAWSEGTLTYNNAPPLGVSATGGHPITLSGSNLNDFVQIDITSLVHGWVAGTIPNHGLALSMVGTGCSFSFDTKESTFTSHQPELEIVLGGPAGAQGPAGPQGPQGAQGSPGPAGPTGPKGATGATGPAGPQGPAGVQGPAGPIGPIGPQGPAGVNGTNGTNGTSFNFRGAFDPSQTYGVNDVTTYGGSTYIAIAASQGPNNPAPDTSGAPWNLMAEVGATGPAGSVGTAGPPGPSGPAGPAGATGATGPAGPAGPEGPAGNDAGTNARMIFPSFFPGNLSGTWTGGQLTLDQPITVLRIAATAKTPTGTGCPAAVFRFTDGTKGQDLVLAPGQYWSDSGPIVLTFAAGAALQASLRTGSTCPSNTGADANLLVEYKMQAAGDADSCPGTQCGGICETIISDPANCGGCGTACPTGQPCTSGTCGLASVGSACSSDTVCQSGSCVAGLCSACAAGQTTCGATCTNTQTDVNNCGACGTVCPRGPEQIPVCAQGQCSSICTANTQTDPVNCGACGHACGAGQQCVSGVCTSGCTSNAQCSGATPVCSSGVCVQCASPTDCPASFCSGSTLSTFACTANVCQTINTQCMDQCSGGSCSSSCTSDSQCGSGRYCTSGGVCATRAANGATCTSGSSCISGNCSSGVCCNTACSGNSCQSCLGSVTGGTNGTCANVTAGTTCTGGTCDGNGTCQQICVPKTCALLGAACGTIGDGCGGTLNCGTCPSGQSCNANVCQ